MRQYLIGLAAAMTVAVASAPASANCGGCAAPLLNYSSCTNPCGGWGSGGWGGGWGYAGGFGYETLAAPAYSYAVQPQYYHVNQGPTYTGPGMFAPVATYQQRAVGGWSGYGVGYYGYNGGPYANPSHHHYHGMPPVAGPTVYSYRRAYRPSYRYGYGPRVGYAPRYGYGPRVAYGPRYGYRPAVRYGHRHHVAPRYVGPRHQMMPHHFK
jgi:hypothetical protein